MDFLHRVQAVVILDEMGNRVFAKYYTGEDAPEAAKALASEGKQRQLEMSIHQAITPRRNSVSPDGDVMIMDGHAVLFQLGSDVIFLVIGDSEENEMVLYNVLKALVDALKQILNSLDLGVRQLLENYDAVLLTVDELLDDGIILEMNPSSIAAEVEPYMADTTADSARKVLGTVNRYLRENL